MGHYERRLAKDLPRWRSAGWVTEEGARAILAENAGARQFGLAAPLAILGAVLMGFAVMSFVAANWQDMSKLARLALLFGALVASYVAAGVLFRRQLAGFAHAAVLSGVAVFGASIMLIAQMYHIDGHPPDAVMTWAAGALLAGVVLNSNPVLALTVLLVGLWAGWETSISGQVFWPFLLGWGAVTGVLLWRGWRPGLHLAGVILAIWIVSLGYILNKGHAHEVVVILGALIAGAGLAGDHLSGPARTLSPVALGYGLAIGFAGLFALQFVDNPPLGALVGLAALTLGIMIGAIVWGWRTRHPLLLWLGYLGFSIELLSLYFKTVGTLLGSSLFFFSAGVIVILLATLAYKLHSVQSDPIGAPQ